MNKKKNKANGESGNKSLAMRDNIEITWHGDQKIAVKSLTNIRSFLFVRRTALRVTQLLKLWRKNWASLHSSTCESPTIIWLVILKCLRFVNYCLYITEQIQWRGHILLKFFKPPKICLVERKPSFSRRQIRAFRAVLILEIPFMTRPPLQWYGR